MSMLEVLQICPTQCKNLLSALGAFDPENSIMITFDTKNYKLRLYHIQPTFQIATRVMGRKVHHTILDDEDSTYDFSMSSWKSIGSPNLNKSPTTLKYFDVRGFQLDGMILALSIELGGKTVYI